MKPVAILCARKRSIYRDLAGLDVFDAERDAFTFAGGMPVVAHPPCRRFGKLSHFVKDADDGRERALGLFCANQVKRWGGVLEHPAYSRLFAAADLPKPGQPHRDGFTVALPQWWFGHLGDKASWFFVAGLPVGSLPEIPLRLDSPERRAVEDLSGPQREATPRILAEWLVAAARLSTSATDEKSAVVAPLAGAVAG